jgi:predicted anti-sigma-YlaC factor YlaD
MSNCKYYRLLISRNIDDDLDANQIDDLNGHINVCKECEKYYLKFNELEKLLDLKNVKALNRYVTNREITVKSASFRKIIFAVSCVVTVFIFSGIIYKLANNNDIVENVMNMDEPLGYLSFVEDDAGMSIGNDITSQPMKTYFSYLGYDEPAP